jgi:CheY-like chemotaxis protein
VLLVDDDVRNIFALTALLEAHDMETLSATNGRSAIHLLQTTPDISLVLMDIMMPEMDGYETMRKLRQTPQLRTLPVLALTAHAMTGDREKCMQAGASDYITKPVKSQELLEAMSAWIAR